MLQDNRTLRKNSSNIASLHATDTTYATIQTLTAIDFLSTHTDKALQPPAAANRNKFTLRCKRESTTTGAGGQLVVVGVEHKSRTVTVLSTLVLQLAVLH